MGINCVWDIGHMFIKQLANGIMNRWKGVKDKEKDNHIMGKG